MRRAPSPARSASARAASNWPMAARSSSTKSAKSRRRFRPSCCACCRRANSSASAAATTIKVDMRLICATNRDLEEMVASGGLPRRPLLSHQCGRDPLAAAARTPRRHSEARQSLSREVQRGKRPRAEFEPDAIDTLAHCYFPGNVRELETASAAPPRWRRATRFRRTISPARAGMSFGDAVERARSACLRREQATARGEPDPSCGRAEASRAGFAGAIHRGRAEEPPPPAAIPRPAPDQERCGVRRGPTEKQKLIAAMEKSGWVQAKAARLLGLTPRQIGYALRKHAIDVERL